MKTKQAVISIIVVALSGFTALAQDANTPTTPPPGTPPPSYPPPNNNPPPPSNEIFQSNEAQLDLFGSGSVNEQVLDHISGKRITQNGRLGAGGGLTFFPSRFVGFGGDVYSENTEHSFINNASGNLYLRFPIDPVHLAPYVYGGAGYQWEPGQAWFAQAGAGVDIRVTHHWGFFVDGRYVLPSRHEQNFGVGRAGIRLVF